MSQPDNKSLDVQRIRAFIEARGGSEVSVEDIMEHSGAERLRVYPILFEMEQRRASSALRSPYVADNNQNTDST